MSLISVNSSSRYPVSRKKISEMAYEHMQNLKLPLDYHLNIAFVGKIKMRQIASTYKHEDVALPVLAFPYFENQDGELFMGEIVICYPQAVLLAAERNKTVDDMLSWLLEHALKNLKNSQPR